MPNSNCNPTDSLDAMLDKEMETLLRSFPVSSAELAECLREVLQDWIGPETEGLRQAIEVLHRFDRQQMFVNDPPWLLRANVR